MENQSLTHEELERITTIFGYQLSQFKKELSETNPDSKDFTRLTNLIAKDQKIQDKLLELWYNSRGGN